MADPPRQTHCMEQGWFEPNQQLYRQTDNLVSTIGWEYRLLGMDSTAVTVTFSHDLLLGSVQCRGKPGKGNIFTNG